MASRIEQLQAVMKRRRLNYLLVTSESNMRWLTGKCLGAVLLLPAKGEPLVITSELEYPRVPKHLKTEISKDWWRTVAKLVQGRIGYEDEKFSVASLKRVQKRIKGKLIPASGILCHLRAAKRQDEIAKIKRAAKITVAGMLAVRRALRPGVTERQLAAIAETAMRRAGADWYAFDPMFAAGDHAAIPHAGVSDRKIRPNDLVIVDIGAVFAGWRADMSRTFCLRPGDKERKIHKTVLAMRAVALKKIRPGVKASAVDRAARDVARKLGLHKAFTHGLGHGVGVEVQESPSLTQKSKDKLKPGMVFTIEPGLYFAGWGGVRIEDTVLLTAKGPSLLTKFPRRLVP